jgi:predicted MFS family arabinose efflux permease
MFVAGSTLVTKAYKPAERAKTQAANDFLVYGTAAVTSLSAGQLLHRQGWQIVLITAVAMILAALAGTVWRRRERVPAVREPR